jgi:hypothetical protein
MIDTIGHSRHFHFIRRAAIGRQQVVDSRSVPASKRDQSDVGKPNPTIKTAIKLTLSIQNKCHTRALQCALRFEAQWTDAECTRGNTIRHMIDNDVVAISM